MPVFSAGAPNFDEITGSIALTQIPDGLFTADATGRAKFANNIINNALITNNAITAAKIQDATITNAKLVNPPGMSIVEDMDTSAGDATSYTFSSLDLDTDGYYELRFHIKNASGSSNDIQIRPNADATSANYYQEYLNASGASVAANNTENDYMRDVTTVYEISGSVKISRGPLGYIHMIVETFHSNGADTTVQIRKTGIVYQSAGNMTSLQIIGTQTNGIAQNSKITLYKFLRA